MQSWKAHTEMFTRKQTRMAPEHTVYVLRVLTHARTLFPSFVLSLSLSLFLSPTAAEHAIYLLLSLLRRTHEMDAALMAR